MSTTTQSFEFHHLGIAVRSITDALPFYENVLGYRSTSESIEDPIQRVTVRFLARSSPGEVIELVAPAPGRSPLRDILARGGGAYHTCYQVPDLELAIEFLLANDCLLVSDPVPAAAFNGRRIAWLYNASRHLLELLEAPPFLSNGRSA